jgi:predicted small lipoprotein YifL
MGYEGLMVASSRFGLIALAAGLIALGLAGCGVRGPLQLPPEAKNAQTTASAESGQGKPEGAAPAPHQSFILDGLLR